MNRLVSKFAGRAGVSRSFSSKPIAHNDLLTDLYVKELKSFKSETATKPDLPETFSAPKPPPKPQVEQFSSANLEPLEASEKAEWPEIRKDPFDEPSMYDNDYEYSCDTGNHLLYRKTPRDYEHHH